jgi:hypothetical protein
MPIIVYPNKPEVDEVLGHLHRDEWEHRCRHCGKVYWVPNLHGPGQCSCRSISYDICIRPRYPENTRTLERSIKWPVFELVGIGQAGNLLEIQDVQ